MHLNSGCFFPNLNDLFVRKDVSDAVQEALAILPETIARLKATLKEAKVPDIDLGAHCTSPYECPYLDHCRTERGLPELSILELYAAGDRKWDYYAQGIRRLDDPRLTGLEGIQARMVEAFKTGQSWIDLDAIRRELERWQWPLHYLDFETVGPAIPRYPGTRPYQNVPFQFSSHTQLRPGGELHHFEFLAEGEGDPRPALVKALLASVGNPGSVVAYNKKFEAACIEALEGAFPEHAEALRSIRERLVDPLPIFRSSVYDPAFQGSFSIKAVAPALLGEASSYEGLAVGDGLQAQLAYEETRSPRTSPARREAIRKALLEYCKQDTLSMVLLVQWLCAKTGFGGVIFE